MLFRSHGVEAATLAGLRPLTPGQEPLVGLATTQADDAAAGDVLVLRGLAVPPPAPVLQRRGLAGVVSERPLRAVSTRTTSPSCAASRRRFAAPLTWRWIVTPGIAAGSRSRIAEASRR